MMRNSENCELRNAGVSTAISTVPESRAAVMTSSHCSNEIYNGEEVEFYNFNSSRALPTATHIDHPQYGDGYIDGQTVAIDAHQRQQGGCVAGL